MKETFATKLRKVLPLRSCGVVIVAAGTASRMGGIDKVMAPLKEEPMILHTVRAFQESPAIKEIVVVTRQDLIEQITARCKDMDKITAVKSGYSNSVDKKWWEYELSCFGHRAIMNDVTAAMACEQLKKLPCLMATAAKKKLPVTVMYWPRFMRATTTFR